MAEWVHAEDVMHAEMLVRAFVHGSLAGMWGKDQFF